MLTGLAILYSSTKAIAATYTKVVDTSTSIPAGQFAGQNFSDFSSSGVEVPPVIDQGQVLFIGKPASTQSNNGAYVWSQGTLQLLADPSVTIPNRGGVKFSQVYGPAIQAGHFAFSSGDGIYASFNSTLTTIIDPSSNFAGSSIPSFDGSTLWFFGENPRTASSAGTMARSPSRRSRQSNAIRPWLSIQHSQFKRISRQMEVLLSTGIAERLQALLASGAFILIPVARFRHRRHEHERARPSGTLRFL